MSCSGVKGLKYKTESVSDTNLHSDRIHLFPRYRKHSIRSVWVSRGDIWRWCFWVRVVQHLTRLRPGDIKGWCSIFGTSPVLTEWETRPDGGLSVTFSSPLANPVYLPNPVSKLFSVTTLCYLFLLFNSALSFGSCLHLGHFPKLTK